VTRRQLLHAIRTGLVALGLSPARARAAAPRVLRVILATEPPQLNPTKATDQVSHFVLGQVMEGLTRYGQHNQLIPGLAESWELRPMGATFRLRPSTWSDGKPVTAHDFVFSWRTSVDPKTASEYAFILYPVKNAQAINAGKMPLLELGVVARDELTLEVTFEQPCGYFLGLTAFSTFYPLREDFYRAKGERYAADAADLLTNGPFTLSRWVHGASLTLEKNPRYWDAQRVQLDRIEIPYITNDPNTAYNLMIDGKIDQIGITKENLDRAQADRLHLRAFADGSTWYLEFNHRAGRPTRLRALRHAIQLVFDPKEFVSRVVGIPGTLPGRGVIPAWVPGVARRFREEYPLPAHQTNPELARRELEVARQELGGTLPSLTLLCDDTPASSRYAEYLQFVLQTRLGLDLRIDKQIFKQRLAKMTSGEFDLVAAGWGPDYADPMTFADLFASWNDNNRGKYSSPEYDALIRQAQASADPKVRMDAMAAAEKVLLADVGIVPQFERVVLYARQPYLSGVVRHAVGPDPDLTWARIEPHLE
jgi:oligopeptide transport system substrate-binding protein